MEAAVAIGVMVLLLATFSLSAPEASAASQVPYADPSVDGYLGICSQQGTQITTGSIDSAPFAWEVVSSIAAPSRVSGVGRTATLYGFQPVEGVDAADWSGEQITGTSRYSNPLHPIAVSTERDFPLSQFLDVFPAKWDGFVELRMFLGAPGAEPSVLEYPALNLRISGNTWHAVGGGPIDCSAGKAVSDEVFLPDTIAPGSSVSPASPTTTANPKGGSLSTSPSGTAGKDDGASGSGSSGAAGGDSLGTSGGTGAQAAPVLSRSSGSHNIVPWVVAVALISLLVAVAGGLTIRAKSRRAAP